MRKQFTSLLENHQGDKAIKTISAQIVSYLRTLNILDGIRWNIRYESIYEKKKCVKSLFNQIETLYTGLLNDDYIQDLKAYHRIDIPSI